MNQIKACFCGNRNFRTKFTYKGFTEVEKKYFRSKNFTRRIIECKSCNHLYSVHKINLNNFYKNNTYLKKHYGDMSKLYETFQKIRKLDPKKSDNFYRIKRIKNFVKEKNLILKRIELLDIGSGTGIFPYLIKKFIKTSMCFEDSSHCSKYLSKYLNLKVISKRQYFKQNSSKKFDLITINKVLEHVENPVNLLTNVYKFMTKNTILYIEVPDAKASKYGKYRGELGIEHHHLFTTKSLKSMISKTNLRINLMKQIKEPSGKYTLFAFLSLK